jgi:Fe-S oxidoreductase
MYHPKDIIEILAGNVRQTRSPFGIPKFMVNNWWKELGLRQQGESLLFTGLMYQFVPYIEKATSFLERFEDRPPAEWLRFGRYQPKRLAGLGLAMITPGTAKKSAQAILRNITRILTQSGVDFFYQPQLDEYSGILLYDLGDQESFVAHARYVAGRLKKAGVRKIITVDPHTTYALKVLYPQYTGEQFEVRTYFELANGSSQNGRGRVTLHDPCFYGRYLELSAAPRKALERVGIECLEVRNSGTFTQCCGGPAESISPLLAREVMERRVEELKATGAPLVAMCPICLGNLRKSGAEVEDLSTILARGLPA